MKFIASILFIITAASCASGNQRSFTGSTPAAQAVRVFLGIPLSDSIDFIRWKLDFKDDSFVVHCRYGIGKPNTNGFINGGKTVDITGTHSRKQAVHILTNGNRTLQLFELNASLLHLMDEKGQLLVGNGGWSFTLNRLNGEKNIASNILTSSTNATIKDSVIYDGRTPCTGLAEHSDGGPCYKLKWRIVLYGDPVANKPTRYYKKGVTPAGLKDGSGTLSIVDLGNDRLLYKLSPNDKSTTFYLLRVDENILVFTDAVGNLLVGNEDFSYTLNRRF